MVLSAPPAPSPTLSVATVEPAQVDATGGFKLVLTGTYSLGVAHQIYVGTAGDNTDPLCYSGIVGQGSFCYPLTATQLVCFTPRIDPTVTNQIVRVVAADSDPPVQLAGGVAVVPGFFYSQTYALRSLFPPQWATGPRSLDAEAPV